MKQNTQTHMHSPKNPEIDSDELVALSDDNLGTLMGGRKTQQVVRVEGQLLVMKWRKKYEEDGIAEGPWS